jgi:hypothetical protein
MQTKSFQLPSEAQHVMSYVFRTILLMTIVGCSESTPTSPSRLSSGGRSDAKSAKPAADPTLRWEIPIVSDGSLKIQGSPNSLATASLATGTPTAYVFDDGVCGVKGTLFESNGGGDASMQANASKPARTCGTPRAARFDLPTGVVLSSDADNV